MKCLNLLVSFLAAAALAGPIEDLQPNCWYEVPNSRPDAVKASSSQFSWLAQGEGFPGIINDWCGGAFDTKRDLLLIGPGGGHNGYFGNEVYGFDLNNLQWRRLTDPDPVSGECPSDPSKPGALHSYDRLEYIPDPVDRYFYEGGWCSANTYMLNLDTKQWGMTSGIDDEGNVTNGMSALDPVTNTVWAGHGLLQQFNPVTKTWGKKTAYDNSIYWGRITLTCDSKRRLLVGVGVVDMGSGASVPATVTWDISNTAATITPVKMTTTGATDIMTGGQNGTEYDAKSDRIVAWKGGSDVYSLDMDTKVWTKHAAINGVNPGPANGNGTFGRFRYSPNKNVFVLVNSTSTNVFLYRLTAGSKAEEKACPAAAGLTVYPNPAKAGETVRFSGTDNLRVVNLAGQRVFSGQGAWKTSGVPAGIYLIQGIRNGRTVSCKILLGR